MSVSLLLALVLAPAPRPASVEIDRATFHALTAASPVEAAVPAWAAQRVLTLTPAPGGVLVRATWTLRSLTTGAWFSGQVLGDMSGVRVESVLWNGAPVATAVGPDGVTVAGKVSGRANLEVVAFVPGDPVQVAMSLRVMPAARGQVIASAPAGLVPLLRAAADLLQRPIEPAPRLSAEVPPPTPLPGLLAMVVARAGRLVVRVTSCGAAQVWPSSSEVRTSENSGSAAARGAATRSA